MRWIIELLNPGDKTLADAAKAYGHEVIAIPLEKDRPAATLPHGPMVFHGSIQKAEEILLDRPDLKPGIWYSPEAFLYSHYTQTLKPFLFNQESQWFTIQELKEQKWEIYRQFGADTKIFVRPDSGTKTFTGRLLDLDDFDRFWDHKPSCQAKPQDRVLVAKPQQIQGEWRFIADATRQILAVSSYMYQGNRTCIPSAPKQASDLAQKILDTGFQPGPLFTLDIIQRPDGTVGLIEANAFATADLYACNPQRIITRAEELIET